MWTDLGAAKPKDVVKAAAQLHTAAQWLGRFGRGLTPAKEDDSHTSFVWTPELQAFATDAAPAPSAEGGGVIQLGLRPSSMTLLLFTDGKVDDGLSLHGRTDAEVGDWLRPRLTALGFGLAGFDAEPPYAAPKSAVAKGKPYDAHETIGALNEIARSYDNAQPLIDAVREQCKSVEPGPSAARSWPHHFDTGLFITLEDAPFETARGIGVGLAVPDSVYAEFYFYTYPWPRHPRKGLPKLKSAGKIHKDGFYGAVLPVSRLAKESDQRAAVEGFFAETVAMWKALLDKEMASETR